MQDGVCTLAWPNENVPHGGAHAARDEPGRACVNQANRAEATCDLPGYEPAERVSCEMDNFAVCRARDLRDGSIDHGIKTRLCLEHCGRGRIFDGHEAKSVPQLGA